MYGSTRFSGLNGALKRSFADVIDAAEDLLRTTGDEANAEYRKARKTLDANLRAAKAHISEQAEDIVSETKEWGQKGNRFVRDNPWTSIGIGAAVGLVAGILLRGR